MPGKKYINSEPGLRHLRQGSRGQGKVRASHPASVACIVLPLSATKLAQALN